MQNEHYSNLNTHARTTIQHICCGQLGPVIVRNYKWIAVHCEARAAIF